MRQREQCGQQRQGIGLGETILGEDLLEFGKLGLGRVVRGELQEPLQMINDGIEGTVLMISRAAKLDTSMSFFGHLLFEFLRQTRFANPSLATEQYSLSFASLGFPPEAL